MSQFQVYLSPDKSIIEVHTIEYSQKEAYHLLQEHLPQLGNGTLFPNLFKKDFRVLITTCCDLQASGHLDAPIHLKTLPLNSAVEESQKDSQFIHLSFLPYSSEDSFSHQVVLVNFSNDFLPVNSDSHLKIPTTLSSSSRNACSVDNMNHNRKEKPQFLRNTGIMTSATLESLHGLNGDSFMSLPTSLVLPSTGQPGTYFMMTDSTGKIIGKNTNIRALFAEEGSVNGLNYLDYVTLEYRDIEATALAQATKDSFITPFTSIFVAKNGEQQVIQHTIIALAASLGHSSPPNKNHHTPSRMLYHHLSTVTVSDAVDIMANQQRVSALLDYITTPTAKDEDFIPGILELAANLLNMDIGIVSKIDGDIYRIHSVWPCQSVDLAKTYKASTTLCNNINEHNNSLCIDYLPTFPEYGKYIHPAFKIESYLGYILNVNGIRFGTLHFAKKNRFPRSFTHSDRDFVRLLSQCIGDFIHRSTHSKLLIEQTVELKQSKDRLQRLAGELSTGNKNLDKLVRERTVQLEETAKKMEQALRVKQEFLTATSHELRTPLHQLTNLIDIFVSSLPIVTPDQAEVLSNIDGSIQQLVIIVKDILEVADVVKDSVVLEVKRFNFWSLINNLIHSFVPIARKKGMQFHYSFTCGRKHYLGDVTRVRKILLNIIHNAFKFTENGYVEVEISTKPAHTPSLENICVVVKDSGIGIPEDKLKCLFSPFTQADAGASRKYGGLGMGLVYSKKLAHQMGGDVTVVSEAGKGSTFTVNFNLEVTEAPPNNASSSFVWDSSVTAGLYRSLTNLLSNEFEVDPTLLMRASKLNSVEMLVKKLANHTTSLTSTPCSENPASSSSILTNMMQNLISPETTSDIGDIVIPIPDEDVKFSKQNITNPVLQPESNKLGSIPTDSFDVASPLPEVSQVDDKSNLMEKGNVVRPLSTKPRHGANEEGSATIGTERVLARVLQSASLSRVLSNSMGQVIESQFKRGGLSKTTEESETLDSVLIAEDNTINLRVAQRIIGQFSKNIQVACNGKEAVAMVKARMLQYSSTEREMSIPYEVIFMDLEMPEMGGIDAAKAILQLPGMEKIPIVACTAYCMDSIRHQCKEAGMQEFIEKPFKVDDVRRVLKNLRLY